jgi:uncharacterized protein YaaQ
MKRISVAVLGLWFCLSPIAHAALLDFLKKKGDETNTSLNLAALSQDQVAEGLKQALGKGVQTAVTNLAKPGGFLDNPKVKIPMPEKLQTIEKGLRALKQDKYADEFVATMNRAAESAVPEALPIFTEALKSMTIDDAKKLVSGGNDSATQFFKGKGEKQVQDKMLPIIKQATEKTGVTASYKKLVDQWNLSNSGAGSLFGKLKVDTTSLDVDKYVTQKASDGLFKMIAEEEERIRKNPAARTTELLQKVFGTK